MRTKEVPLLEPLGIEALEGLVYYVHDLDRSEAFYEGRLGFRRESAREREAEETRVFAAGRCRVACAAPRGDGDARRFLRNHPDGIGEVVFRVRDASRAFRILESRGATPIDEVAADDGPFGEGRSFAIATPFGTCLFRFLERERDAPRAEDASSPYSHVDHLTANFETIAPTALWLEHVMGFRDFWKVELGTEHEAASEGTGLRSRVMVDPESGLKFAINEPRRPNFHASQIDVFVDDNRGPGIQHAALAVRDLVGTVARLRARGVAFLPTDGRYYDAAPARLASRGVAIDESIDDLRREGILVDGSGRGRYLLQIFLRDSASLYHEPDAGPFFFELIERKGDPGFGEGNFRALFETIERDQLASKGG